MGILDEHLRPTGQSFASYFGSTRDIIDCGVSVGIPVDDSIDTLVNEVQGYVDAGYRRVKLKIQPGWDIEPTRVIREMLPDMPLQVSLAPFAAPGATGATVAIALGVKAAPSTAA